MFYKDPDHPLHIVTCTLLFVHYHPAPFYVKHLPHVYRLPDPPSISKEPSHVVADEGTTGIGLSCLIDANPHPNTITWTTCDDEPMAASNVDKYPVGEKMQTTLHFHGAISKGMFCNYTCSASNIEGMDSHTIVLTGRSEYYIWKICISQRFERSVIKFLSIHVTNYQTSLRTVYG